MQTASQFQIPESVRAYLTDPSIRTGVNALVDVDAADLPPELDPDEFEEFFDARAAAELTKFEFALALYRLWAAVWEPAINTTWRRASSEELVDDEVATVQQCWDEKSFQMFHKRDGCTLYTAVHLSPKLTTLAFGLEDLKDSPLLNGDAEPFIWEGDGWEGWLVLSLPTPATDESFDLISMQDAARAALKYAHEATQGQLASRVL